MPDEQTPATPAPETPPAPVLPPEVEARLQKADALEKQNKDFLAEIKKLKGNSKAADEAAKTAEEWKAEARKSKAEASVWRSLNAEGITVKGGATDWLHNAILAAPGVEVTDEGVKGVPDALKALREALGGIPEPAKPEASPAMAKAKSNAAAPDPKFAKVETLADLTKMGVEAFNEFTTKYPDRFAALGRKK